MEDHEIVRLYWARDQQALQETGEKYGAYLRKIALNILADPEDAEECVNDTYAGAWGAIPPHSPEALSAFLGKLTRRISLNRLRELRSYKRGGGQAEAALDELAECVPSDDSTEDAVEAAELGRALDAFLDTLPHQRRTIFVRRYWHMEPIADIAAAAGMSEGAVKTTLFRTREKLKSYLKKEGWI